jgi:hypothetical protein
MSKLAIVAVMAATLTQLAQSEGVGSGKSMA